MEKKNSSSAWESEKDFRGILKGESLELKAKEEIWKGKIFGRMARWGVECAAAIFELPTHFFLGLETI